MSETTTIHASAVLIGARAALIRGPSGSGKSRLALALLQASSSGALPFARLVADDRVYLQAQHERLLLRSPSRLAGLLEVRNLGLFTFPHEPVAVAAIIVDLSAADVDRLPSEASRSATLDGVRLPRLAVAPGDDALPLLLTLFSDNRVSAS